MVNAKTILKGAGIVILALVLIRLALWLLGVVVTAVIWAIQTAIMLLFLGLLLYGAYWAYTKFTSDSKSSSREREKVFER